MSGSEEVGVDPGRVNQAAAALENLRDVLAANVPIIVNTMNEYWSSGAGSPISLAALQQAQSRSVDDATQMRTRAQLAEAWLAQKVSLAGSGMVNIPWSGPALDNADATVEAKALAAAEAEAVKDPGAARSQITAIEQEISEHVADGKDGAGWLQAFYNDAAPSVANLASTLHTIDTANQMPNDLNKFTVLTQDDQKIVATFAQGLAEVDRAGKLSPDAVNEIANAQDAWSAAMLVKFGPPGNLWATSEPKGPGNADGLSLLAVLTNNVYEQEQKGLLRIPIGAGNHYESWDRDQLAQTLADYDPLQVMMQADAQNKNASWQVMGGQYGAPLAQMLLNSVHGDLPGLDGRFVQGPLNDKDQFADYFTLYPPGKSVPGEVMGQILLSTPDQNVVGAFLDAATSAPRGSDTNAWYSAQAAKNIILSTPSPIGDNGITEDPAVEKALLDIAQRYMLDLADSTTYTGPGSHVIHYGGGNSGPFVLKIFGDSDGSTPLSTFLQQIMTDGPDGQALKAMTVTAMSQYYALWAQGKTPPEMTDPDVAMAKLYAREMVEAGNVKLNTATLTDEQDQQINNQIDFAKDAVTWIPVVGDYADQAESLLGLFGVTTDLSTDHAVAVQQSNERDFAVSESTIDVPMVQALINAGGVPAKDLNGTSSWLVNGKIDLNASPDSSADFSSWEDAHPHIMDTIDGRISEYDTQMGQQEQIAENQAGSGG